MTLGITPITERAYTKQGNEYTKTNHGKFAAVAAIGVGAAFTAAEFGIHKAKKIKMPNFKAIPGKVTDYFKNLKMPNFKQIFAKASDKVLSYVEKHPVRTKQAAIFAGVAAGVIAVGVATDAIVNKIRAKKADKAARV